MCVDNSQVDKRATIAWAHCKTFNKHKEMTEISDPKPELNPKSMANILMWDIVFSKISWSHSSYFWSNKILTASQFN